MKRLSTILALSMAAVLTLGLSCAAQEVHTDFDHNAQFNSFHSFCFTRVHASNQLVEGRLRDAITRELTAKGWQLASGDSGQAGQGMQASQAGQPGYTGQCDVSVAAIGYVGNSQEYSTFYGGMGGGWGWRGRWGWGGWGGAPAITTVDNIPVGTLSIDLYKTQDKSLIWRGTSKQEISDDPQKNVGKLNKAVHKIFDKFPPKG